RAVRADAVAQLLWNARLPDLSHEPGSELVIQLRLVIRKLCRRAGREQYAQHRRDQWPARDVVELGVLSALDELHRDGAWVGLSEFCEPASTEIADPVPVERFDRKGRVLFFVHRWQVSEGPGRHQEPVLRLGPMVLDSPEGPVTLRLIDDLVHTVDE